MRVSRDCIDDDRWIVNSRSSDFDCFSAVIDDDHFLDVHLALEMLPAVEDVAAHLLVLLHCVT